MSQPRIKRDAFRHEKRTRELLRASIATVAIAQEHGTGKILAVGLDHCAVATRLAVDGHESNWEIKEHRLWR